MLVNGTIYSSCKETQAVKDSGHVDAQATGKLGQHGVCLLGLVIDVLRHFADSEGSASAGGDEHVRVPTHRWLVVKLAHWARPE